MSFIIKAVIILLFVFIFYSLASALYYIVKGGKDSKDKIVKALTWRIGLSIVVFMLLFIAFAMGWITPHSI